MSRSAAAIAALFLALTAAGCGGEAELSSQDVKRDASFVFRADLQPGNSGKDAAKLVRSWISLDGVAGTHGDAGKHVWIYGESDATVKEMNAVRSHVESHRHVATVVQQR